MPNLEVDDSGIGLRGESIKLKPNQFDGHPQEEGLLLKESGGGAVIAKAID